MAERNLPTITIPSAPAAYDAGNENQFRQAVRQHWHPGGVVGGSGDVTVLLPLDNGIDPLEDGQWVTAIVTFGYRIVGYRLIQDCNASGSLVLKVLYADNVAFPTFTEISGTDRPTLVSADDVESVALTGWTTTGSANSQLRAVVVGTATTITRAVLALALQKL